MGFDSFEFGLEDPSHVDPAKLKAKAEQTGLKLVICGAFGPDRDLTHDDAGRPREQPELHHQGDRDLPEVRHARCWPGRCTRPSASGGT